MRDRTRDREKASERERDRVAVEVLTASVDSIDHSRTFVKHEARFI